MPRKELQLPPEVAIAFVRDLRAFFAEKNGVKADAIAAQQTPYPAPALQRQAAHCGREGDVPGDAGRGLSPCHHPNP